MIELKRHDGESERQYIWRLATAKDSGQLECSWDDLAHILNDSLRPDCPYEESAYRKPYTNAKAYYDDVFAHMQPEDVVDQYASAKRALQIERNKLQSEKIENSRWLREYARDELICEKITDAILSAGLPCPPAYIAPESSQIEYCLCFGDEHYGTEFELRGLYGDILNAYSPEIFERRMEKLFSYVLDIVRKENIGTLHVFSMGDFTDGLIRVGQLMKLRFGVVEGTVLYARYIAQWLNELSKHVRVEYQMCMGNHSEIRALGQPKGTFKDENMGIVVKEIISTSLKNNPNFTFVQNPTGLIFAEICGYNVLGIHGEVNSLERAIKDFSNTYGVQIDCLVAGHKHHSAAESVGICREVISVPSIIGADDYSLSLNKTSNPGATLFAMESGRGKVLEYDIRL